jgi:hypothetical protein
MSEDRYESFVDHCYQEVLSPGGVADQDQRKARGDALVPTVCHLALGAMAQRDGGGFTRENVEASVQLAAFIGGLDREEMSLVIFGLATMVLESDLKRHGFSTIEEYKAFVTDTSVDMAVEQIVEQVALEGGTGE